MAMMVVDAAKIKANAEAMTQTMSSITAQFLNVTDLAIPGALEVAVNGLKDFADLQRALRGLDDSEVHGDEMDKLKEEVLEVSAAIFAQATTQKVLVDIEGLWPQEEGEMDIAETASFPASRKNDFMALKVACQIRAYLDDDVAPAMTYCGGVLGQLAERADVLAEDKFAEHVKVLEKLQGFKVKDEDVAGADRGDEWKSFACTLRDACARFRSTLRDAAIASLLEECGRCRLEEEKLEASKIKELYPEVVDPENNGQVVGFANAIAGLPADLGTLDFSALELNALVGHFMQGWPLASMDEKWCADYMEESELQQLHMHLDCIASFLEESLNAPKEDMDQLSVLIDKYKPVIDAVPSWKFDSSFTKGSKERDAEIKEFTHLRHAMLAVQPLVDKIAALPDVPRFAGVLEIARALAPRVKESVPKAGVTLTTLCFVDLFFNPAPANLAACIKKTLDFMASLDVSRLNLHPVMQKQIAAHEKASVQVDDRVKGDEKKDKKDKNKEKNGEKKDKKDKDKEKESEKKDKKDKKDKKEDKEQSKAKKAKTG